MNKIDKHYGKMRIKVYVKGRGIFDSFSHKYTYTFHENENNPLYPFMCTIGEENTIYESYSLAELREFMMRDIFNGDSPALQSFLRGGRVAVSLFNDKGNNEKKVNYRCMGGI